MPLSTQVYKWVPVNCWGNLTNCGGVTCDGLASRPGGVEILLAASCYRNRDKLRQLWVNTGSKALLFLKRQEYSKLSSFKLSRFNHADQYSPRAHFASEGIWKGFNTIFGDTISGRGRNRHATCNNNQKYIRKNELSKLLLANDSPLSSQGGGI